MAIMETLKIVLNILPMLIQVIKAVEDAIPGQGKGEQKLALVRGVLEAVDSGVMGIWPVLEKVIASIVSVFNKTGTFEAPSK